MSENGEIYTTGKNFTLPPAVTGVTNSTSALTIPRRWCCPGQGSYPFAADTWPVGQSCQIQQCATSQLVRLKKCKVEDDIVFWGDGDGVILRIVIRMNMMAIIWY